LLKSLATDFYKLGVIKIGEFELKSKDISPYYIDLRLIPSDPIVFQKVMDIYEKLFELLNYKPNAVAGIMSAGIPFATALCLRKKLSLLKIRSEAKEHGTKKIIEGIIPIKGSKVVLLDDVISTGESKLNSFHNLIGLGLDVSDLIVLVDRTSGDDVEQVLKSKGLNIVSAGTPKDLLEGLLETKNLLSIDEINLIQKALRSW
jgi:uridine monophosphate synthetase